MIIHNFALTLLTTLMFFDIITGIAKAYKSHNIRSRTFFFGNDSKSLWGGAVAHIIMVAFIFALSYEAKQTSFTVFSSGLFSLTASGVVDASAYLLSLGYIMSVLENFKEMGIEIPEKLIDRLGAFRDTVSNTAIDILFDNLEKDIKEKTGQDVKIVSTIKNDSTIVPTIKSDNEVKSDLKSDEDFSDSDASK